MLLFILCLSIRVLKLSTEYSSTQVLSLSLPIYGRIWVVLRVPVLYISIGPCNLAPNCLNIGVLTLNLLYYYLDAIFVLPVLGTCQGMSTKAGDRNMYENLHKLA